MASDTLQTVLEFIGKDGGASGLMDSLASKASGLGNVLSSALTAAAGVAAAGITGIGAVLGISLREAISAQQGMADLNATLNATGRTNLHDQILKDAQALKDLAGGSDDAVIAVENMLVGFKEIGDTTLPGATKATLDLAAKLKIGGDAAADLLGPILATGDRLNALKKANVTFTDSEEKKIKALFAAGDAAGAQQIILDKLQATIGGTAASAAGTLAGRFEILKGHLLDAAEGIGTSLLPLAERFFGGVIEPAIPIIEGMASAIANFITLVSTGDWGQALFGLSESLGSISSLIGQAFGPEAQALFDAFTEGIRTLGSSFEEAMGAINFTDLIPPDAIASFQPLMDALANLGAAFQEQMPAMQAQGATFIAWLQSAFATIGPVILDNLTTAINAMAEIWRAHGDEIMTVIRVAFEIILATVGGTLVLLSGIISATMQILNGDWTGAWQTIQDTVVTFMNMVLSIVGTNLDQFLATWAADWELLKTIVAAVVMNLTSQIQQWIIDTVNTLTGYYDKFKEIGTALIENVRLGIMLKVSQIINAVRDMVNDAVAAAGAALGGAFGGGATAGATGGGGPGGGGPNYAEGGVSSGPLSGYPITSHGLEAHVPLSGGRSIPVTITNAGSLMGGAGGQSMTFYGPVTLQLEGGAFDLNSLLASLHSASGMQPV